MLHINHILMPTDFSTCAERAFTHAVHLARKYGAVLHVLNVRPPHKADPNDPMDFLPLEQEDAVTWSDAYVRTSRAHEVPVIHAQVRVASPAVGILDYADRHDIDLIVIGTHGRRGFKHFMLGSVAEEVVRRAGCDVLAVREGAARDEVQVRRILVALDLSSHSAALLQRAREMAASYGAALDVLHVIDTLPLPVAITGAMTVYDLVPNLREQALDHMRRLLAKTGGPEVPAALHVEEGHPPSAIVDVAIKYGADLIMIGRQGRSAMERFFLGSVAERVVRTAESPVLVVRTEEAEAVPEPAVQEIEQAQ